MPQDQQDPEFDFLGTNENDKIAEGFQNERGDSLGDALDGNRVNGRAGDDTITMGDGANLAAGDMVGDEWSFVDGKWVYNQDAVVASDMGTTRSYDDVITTGSGDDVLLGNGGADVLTSGAGKDLINAGTGNDRAFAGDGNDIVNLEHGNDYACLLYTSPSPRDA